MSLFRRREITNNTPNSTNYSADLAQRVLNSITEGVMLVDGTGVIQFANPAAAKLAGYQEPSQIVGLDIHSVLRLESSEGAPVPVEENTLFMALEKNQSVSTHDYLLVSAQTDQRTVVSLSCTPTGNERDYRIITMRDITSEVAEENERTEFISTASHEMRTPVASIEGYLALALNPQTATIDDRARNYLQQAHSSSQHLGKLFRDLLDVTKLDDHRLHPHYVPVDAVEAVKQIADECAKSIPPKKLKYSFGTGQAAPVSDEKHIEPKVYMAVDMDFLRAILENLIGNAIKYTPDGGEIWVSARGDGDKVLINVTDTGIGVPADDLPHLFQKFYRVDNSQTRQIGGTGLGLYLVKQRVEAMGGRVWVESAFGDGSTFYVSLPRLSDQEYEKLRLAQSNQQMVQNFGANTNDQNVAVASPIATITKTPVVAPPNNTAVAQSATSPQPIPTSPQTTVSAQAEKNNVAQPGDTLHLQSRVKLAPPSSPASQNTSSTDGQLAEALKAAQQAMNQNQ